MTRKQWHTLIAMLWLALPVMGLRYWLAWDRLPARVATHFDAAGRANGWMPRVASLMFTLGFIAFLVILFTLVLYFAHKKYTVGMFSWALLGFFHVEIWTLVYMLNSTLDYNLSGTPIVTAPFLLITPVAVVALIVIGFAEKRGSPLPSNEIVAAEVHSGKAWGWLFALPVLAAGGAIAVVPNFGLRLGAGLLFLLFIAVFGMAWDGFHYYFTRNGVEIRSLGLRLKSIPLSQIKQYAAENWNPMGGYGVRGMGNYRAYVWGNRGVRIHLYDGEVFLGHSQPDRIVHDLDVIKQFAH